MIPVTAVLMHHRDCNTLLRAFGYASTVQPVRCDRFIVALDRAGYGQLSQDEDDFGFRCITCVRVERVLFPHSVLTYQFGVWLTKFDGSGHVIIHLSSKRVSKVP